LGLVAEALVDPAAALLAEEDAAAVGPVIEDDPARPGRPGAPEGRQAAQVRLAVPALLLDALSLFVGDRDDVFLAARAGLVAAPVLHDGQVPNDGRHDAFAVPAKGDEAAGC